MFLVTTHYFLATPADCALLMQLGVDGCFVGSGIFKSNNPKSRGKAMVQAVTHYNDPVMLAKISENLGTPMVVFIARDTLKYLVLCSKSLKRMTRNIVHKSKY